MMLRIAWEISRHSVGVSFVQSTPRVELEAKASVRR